MLKTLTDEIFVAPQISIADIETAKALGVTLVVNNRPDHESPDQPEGMEIEAAAREAGLDYVAIPVTHAGFSAWQLDEMEKALSGASGKVLAFCRSGTRSTLLWALTRARAGDNCDKLSALAAKAGYDLTPIRPMMDALSAGR
ncbi:TIGR01244 family sulfur transferase [Rhizorhapis sp.]|uniref:TIGR01244 family sulfur transferase n=1 Tax=Rhizorhapis sp. TaxID=1968842 RepID=UPI002B477E35|nr:TIGR01244 family sulfur transferase [Rhizorhapis sp.]HKR18332.1 TIGR01244 family sulfur transferase [Rhizorhapis sp.]